MKLEEQLIKAIEFAVDSNYSIYNKQGFIWERLKTAKTICIFGTGKYYSDLKEKGFLKTFFKSIAPIKYVCDNNSYNWGKKYITNIDYAKCISPEELSRLDDVVTLIAVGEYKEIQKQLTDLQVENYTIGDLFLREYDQHYSKEWFINNRDRIINALEVFDDYKSKEIYTEVICNRIAPEFSTKTFNEIKEENEYFSTDIFKLTDDEYIADCGAFIGDSLEEFYEIKKGKFGAYYCFELDNDNCEICNKKIDSYNNNKIELIRAGVSDKNEIISITKSNGFSSRIDGKGNKLIKANIVKIDDALKDKKVTFIKMDIEGAEIPALKGAEKIIKEQNPKLVISAYHYLSDLWEIPLLIKEMNPKYKIYMRHHTTAVWDTDCYAYIQ
ncbi:FkbM family methyltransferase [Clostridium beijerinckii]|uniref:FkbM family methyltransferase n=1 Tax=Clostridium beijerinckii TaxID=1520 RepID=UPI00232CC2FE|nr:FkbM family methyltransferase [Clostridium beijerinckii]